MHIMLSHNMAALASGRFALILQVLHVHDPFALMRVHKMVQLAGQTGLANCIFKTLATL